MEFFISIVVGISSSIAASILFIHLYLAKKVPVIEISPYIANESDNQTAVFWFKYINKTDVPIYDVKVEAYFLTPVGGDGGQNLRVTDISIKHTTYTHVPAENRSDHNAVHAVQVRCTENLLEGWINEASFIRFQVIAKHELSGFSKVFVRDFHNKNKIIKGSFKFGNDTAIS